MTGPSSAVADKLRTIQARFAGQLPARMAAVLKAWDRLKDDDSREALRNFHFLVHSMAGSGGTFGFKALGEHSLRIEKILYPMLENNGRPDKDAAVLIDGLLRNMADAAKPP